jgi:hypothetical protein
MNLPVTVWRQLVQRRLLPVAILLVAALAAVPVLLAQDAEPAPAPARAGADKAVTASAAVAEPIVELVEEGDRTKRRRVLGARKNPFEPAKPPKATKAKAPASAPASQAPTSGGTPAGGAESGAGSGSGGSGAPSAGTPSSPPAGEAPLSTPPVTTPPAAEAPKRKQELYSLTVRFGDSTQELLPKMNLARLKPLPSATNPILVYLGVAEDKKTAIFMVDAAVQAQGDGVCRPDPAVCETIHLRVGDTEFFDVKDESGAVSAQYQLDLLEIERRTTSSASKARAARARVSEAGRKVLRAHKSQVGPLRYRYDAESGTVRKLGAKAWKGVVAEAAKAVKAAL